MKQDKAIGKLLIAFSSECNHDKLPPYLTNLVLKYLKYSYVAGVDSLTERISDALQKEKSIKRKDGRHRCYITISYIKGIIKST